MVRDFLATVRDAAGQNARSVIEALRLEAERLAAIAQGRADPAITAEGARNTAKWTATVGAQAQIDISHLLSDRDLEDVLAIRSEEFNALITNLSQDIHHRIERSTIGAIYQNKSQEQIAGELREIDGIGRNRARLIARDQAAKLNSAMNEYRQEQAGITHYKWIGLVNRERETHLANNNRIFAWAKPSPITGHPGHDINCRCRAAAVIDDEPEDVAPLPDPKGDAADLISESLPLIREVAQTPREKVFEFSPAEIDDRLTKTNELAAKVAALRKANTLSASDADRLLTEVYGYKPAPADLDALLGNGLKAALAKPQTRALAAVQARLDLIQNLLRNALGAAKNEGKQ